uniref:Coatomer subunit beta-1 n=1 Tax=Aegilops tauschii TaxID=37682 RepID=M8BKU4_AEGTA
MSLISTATTDVVVVYDCARTLLSVSHEPTLIHAAAEAYFRLLSSQSDNKVRLIILDRLHELCASQRHMMVSFVMDILHSLASADADLDVRSKVLDLVIGLLTTQNVEKAVLYLKNEVSETMDSVHEMAYEYYLVLVETIHACAVEYPSVAGLVMHILLDFLVYGGDIASASDVIMFVRDVIGTDPLLRVSVIVRLVDLLSFIQDSFICSCALWILGEYSFSLSEVRRAISTIMRTLGDQPFNDVSEKSDESIFDCTPTSGLLDCTHSLRFLIMSGDFHLAAVVACTLTKLVLRLEEVEANKASAESLLIMVSMLQLGKSSYLPHPIDNDSYDRIVFCVRLLYSTDYDHARKVWLLPCRQSFTKMLAEKQSRKKNDKMKVEAQNAHAHTDDSIDFYHLVSRSGMGQLIELEDEFQDDLKAVTGEFKDADDANKLNRPIQLTGFSDPLYAEGFVTVNQYYDTVLDITVMNRTQGTMHNLCLEFATACKNAVLERSPKYTVAPNASEQIQANIKVSSSNVGIIMTRIVYETSDEMGTSEVILKDMNISIADYMTPATCNDVAFRRMWAECPWKVKMKVNTLLQDEKAFVNFIIKSTNMNCLTPLSALDGDCGFVAANLYAECVWRACFGEHQHREAAVQL